MSNPEVEEVLAELGIDVSADGHVALVHATLATSADAIKESGTMVGVEGIYLCTSKSIVGRIVEPVEGVLHVRVAVDDLTLHRRPDELTEMADEAQAEFIVLANDGEGYAPVCVGAFEPLKREDFD